MHDALRLMVQDAAAREGWSKPVHFHRALQSAGVDVTHQTAGNWWHGKCRVSLEHVPNVASLLGVPELLLYRMLRGGR